MLRFTVLLLLAIASCSGITDEEVYQQYRQEGQVYLPNFPPQADPTTFDPKNIKFYLYTSEKPFPHEIVIGDLETLRNSSYNQAKETKFIIHDWLSTESNVNDFVLVFLRHHSRKDSLNVITVDYGRYSNAEPKDFLKIVGKIGETFGKLLQMLHEYGADPKLMHVVGVGFGAHMAGTAAKSVLPMKIGRLTGLDPIGLGYDQNGSSEPQMEPTDAEFTDTITTSMRNYGSPKTRAVSKFYPNNGQQQPDNNSMFLSHVKARFYFTESVALPKAFKGTQFWGRNARQSVRNEAPEHAYMGEFVSQDALAEYLLNTNALPPYGQNIGKE